MVCTTLYFVLVLSSASKKGISVKIALHLFSIEAKNTTRLLGRLFCHDPHGLLILSRATHVEHIHAAMSKEYRVDFHEKGTPPVYESLLLDVPPHIASKPQQSLHHQHTCF